MVDHVFIVIPCYNEQFNIANTCYSLGFGKNCASHERSTTLVLVNNNSTDGTEQVLQQIKSASSPGDVFIHFEPLRGYVSARHSGNLFAREICNSNNWNIQNVLIIQADADTEYFHTYIDTIVDLSSVEGSNVLVEATVGYDAAFRAEYSSYLNFCKKVDNEVEQFFPTDWNEDVIVDDKVSSYRLNDYFNWGGHVSEIFSDEKIYAETTRLYIKGKSTGARKVFTERTWAFHSSRKLLKNPSLQFITAGFPRVDHSLDQIIKDLSKISNEKSFESLFEEPTTKMIEERKVYSLALFSVLPFHVGKAIGDNPKTASMAFYSSMEHYLPQRSFIDFSQPGIFLYDILLLIDTRKEEFINTYNVMAIK
jgi:glycosyltransferase involved in cell wall biosynthesis